MNTVDEKGHIVISYPNLSLFAHEVRHADKVFLGIAIPNSSSGNFALRGWSRQMYEADSYRAQYALDPNHLPNSTSGTVRSINDITPTWADGVQDNEGNNAYQ